MCVSIGIYVYKYNVWVGLFLAFLHKYTYIYIYNVWKELFIALLHVYGWGCL